MDKIKDKINFIIFTLAILSSAIIILFYITNNIKGTNKAEIPIFNISGSYSIDVSNPKAIVGDADYVFVGQVIEETGTIYKNKVPIEQENGEINYIGSPYTNYSVSIIKNLKNELITDDPISILKSGGIREDGSAYDIFESDTLPEVGKTYIFSAYTQDDGSLLVVGPNSTISIDNANSSPDTLTKSSEYKTYEAAVKDPIKTNRKHLKSKYDKEKY